MVPNPKNAGKQESQKLEMSLALSRGWLKQGGIVETFKVLGALAAKY